MNLSQSFEGFVFRRSAVFITMAVLLASLLSLLLTVYRVERSLGPEIEALVSTVVRDVAEELEYSVYAGVPLEKLRGLDLFLEETKADYPQIANMRIRPSASLSEAMRGTSNNADPMLAQTLASTSDATSLSQLNQVSAWLFNVLLLGQAQLESQERKVTAFGITLATVEADLNQKYVISLFQKTFFDMLVVVVAAVVLALEIMVALIGVQIATPLQLAERLIRNRDRGRFLEGQTPGPSVLQGAIKRMLVEHRRLRKRLERMMDSGVERLRTSAFHISDSLFGRASSRKQTALDIRLPMFLFISAEMLQRPFLPVFAAEKALGFDQAPVDLLAGLPITLFMLASVILTPVAGQFAQRIGHRRLFIIGILPALIGHVGNAFADSVFQVMLFRTLSGAGYGIVTIACQTYIVRVATGLDRAKELAMYVGIMTSGTLFGTAIGALLASQFGYSIVFMTGGLALAFAALIGWIFIPSVEDEGEELTAALGSDAPAASQPATQWVSALLSNPGLLGVYVLGAVNQRIIVNGFVYFFVPLYLASLGATTGDTGRILLLYGLVMVFTRPVVSLLLERVRSMALIVALATVASGGTLLLFPGMPHVAGLVLLAPMLSIAHSCIEAPMAAAVLESADRSPAISPGLSLSLLKLSERSGGVLGPIVVAALMTLYPLPTVAVILGISVCVGGVLLWLLSFFVERRSVHV